MKKIMFDDHYGLERAVLEGRKTMTRRIVPEKLQATFDACSKGVLVIPLDCIPDDVSVEEFAEQWSKYRGQGLVVPVKDEPNIQFIDGPAMVMEHSRFQKGELVAIAQAYKDLPLPKGLRVSKKVRLSSGHRAYEFQDFEESSGWNNKMFVRADLMPHGIRITDIKVERLQDISVDDILKEGVFQSPFGYCVEGIYHKQEPYYKDAEGNDFKYEVFARAEDAFAALIEKISGKGIWEKNPWVFAYTFEHVKLK